MKNLLCTVNAAERDALKAKAQAAPLRRARICLHDSPADLRHEMVIALCPDSYIPPHRRAPGFQTYVVLEGCLCVALFRDDGSLLQKALLRAGDRSVIRFPTHEWHTAVAVDGICMYVEFVDGPLLEDTIESAAWAPGRDEAARGMAWLKQATADVR